MSYSPDKLCHYIHLCYFRKYGLNENKNGHLEPSLKLTEVNENISISSSMSWIRFKKCCEQKQP